MGKTFFKLFGCVFTVVGSMIGAGFITGKEIAVFFCSDLSLSGIYACCVFFFLYILILSFSPFSAFVKIFRVIVAVTGIVISACMTAALNSLYQAIFRQSENIKILTIITVILSFFMCLKGIGAINVFSIFAMPFTVATVFILSFVNDRGISVPASPVGLSGAFMPLLYTGINCLLSSTIIVDSSRGLNARGKIIVAFSVSFFLFVSILRISLCVVGKSGEMPFINAVANDAVSSVIAFAITFFSIVTTLVSSLYSAFSLTKGKTSVLQKIALTLVVVMFSGFGFSVFVEKIYPVIGVTGIVYLVIVFAGFFPKERRGRTLVPIKCKV